MTRYLISFDAHAMDHIPGEEGADVAKAAHAAVQEAINAGVPSRAEALQWAAKIAVACRCAQEVREIGHDPELDEMLREADSRP